MTLTRAPYGYGWGRRPGPRGFGNAAVRDPLAIFGATLKYWWRGDSGFAVASTGWVDKVAAANIAPTAAEEPAAGSLGGRVAADMTPADANSDGLQHAASTALYNHLHSGAGGTYAVVFNLATLATPHHLLDNIRSAPATRAGIDIRCNGLQLEIEIGNGTAAVIDFDVAGLLAVDTNYLLALRYATANTPDCEVWVVPIGTVLNPASATGSGNNLASPSAGDAALNMFHGAESRGTSTERLDGDIAEILTATTAATNDQLVALSKYVNAYYTTAI